MNRGLCFVTGSALILGMLWGCLGASQTHSFDFMPAETRMEHQDVLVRAMLTGIVSRPGAPDGGSPYTLTMVVSSISGFYRSADISALVLEDARGNRVPLPREAKKMHAAFVETGPDYVATFSVPGLPLAYSAHRLVFNLAVTTHANSCIRKTVSLALHPVPAVP